MEPTIEVKKPIKFIGIGIKIPAEEGQMTVEVEQIWKKFFDNDCFHKISNKATDNILVLYSHCDQVEPKVLEYYIGCEVVAFDYIPPGMEAREIASARYAQFIVQGKYPESLVETWEAIRKSGLNRAHLGDIEIYEAKSGKPDFNKIIVCVTIE